MSKKPLSTCPVCSKAFNDNTKLPLVTPCQHTHCLACLREHTLAQHPGVEASREGQLPSGKEIECPKCQKRVNTDEFVIDRAALATVPLSLEDLIIAHDSLPKTKPSKSGETPSKTKTRADPARPLGNTTHSDLGPSGKTPQGVEYGLGGDTHSPYDTTPGQKSPWDPARDLGVGTTGQASATVISGVSQGPIGWTRPTSPPLDTTMDPNHPHHHHPHPQGHGQAVGWAVPPGYVPPPTGPYTQMPLPPGHHHPHGHTVAAGAAGVAAGAAAGAGVTALAMHKKKKKGKKGKKEKKHKEGRQRSSSSSSSGSSRSSSSSRSSKSSNSS